MLLPIMSERKRVSVLRKLVRNLKPLVLYIEILISSKTKLWGVFPILPGVQTGQCSGHMQFKVKWGDKKRLFTVFPN